MNSPVNTRLSGGLLSAQSDPEPVELVNAGAVSPLLLVCEHAGRVIPESLSGLGLSGEELDMHIAYDIGAENLARELAGRFGCTLVVQRYSRLVIDCNRPPGNAQSIPETSDQIDIPGNRKLSQEDRECREREIFEPFARAGRAEISREHIRYAFSVHSFTPVMDGLPRPWDIGFLYRHRSSGGGRLVKLARQLWPDMTVGDNQPYRVEDGSDWFIPVCAESRNIPHSLIEVRNDHLRNAEELTSWADRLHSLLSRFMEQTDGINP